MRLPSLFGNSRSRALDAAPGFFDLKGTLYAVGDVHGELSLLQRLVERIAADVARPGTRGPKRLVFLGDYVDRGPDSRGVLEYLSTLRIEDCELIFILGNHDRKMIEFVDDPMGHRRWLDWGGRDTLRSFGVEPLFPTATDAEFARAAESLGDALGDLRSFVEERTVVWHRIGNIVLSHAGMEPDFTFEDQRERTMLWGSQAFLDIGGPPGHWYVHGHYIHDEPAIVGNRIAVDTGAYESGVLSVARITSDGCAFLQQR